MMKQQGGEWKDGPGGGENNSAAFRDDGAEGQT